MAVPSYTTDLTTYNDCTSATGWLELTGMALSAPPDVDSDLAIHGGICITSDRAKTGLSSNAYVGAGITLAAGECIFVWHKFFAPNSLATLANGGVRVMIGDSGTVYDGWYMDGSDTYPYGGWVNHVVDPTTTPDQTVGTTTGTYAMVGNGWNLPTQAPSKGNPFGTDIIRYGRGESIFTGGETDDYATFAGYALVNDHPTTGRFGLIQALTPTSYLYKGLMSLGTSATAVDMRDANVTINIDNTFQVASSFNRIEINNASSNIEWVNISFFALGTVSKGQLEMIDNATFSDTGGAFTDMDTFIYDSNATLTRRTFRRCGQVTQGGATFTDCIFDKPSGTVGLLVDSLADVSGCDFNSDGTGHAVNLGTISSNLSVAWANNIDGYASSNGSTGNEVILVNVASGITLTINVTAGYSTPTYYNTGTGTVNVVSGLVDFSFDVEDQNGAPMTGYEWRLYDNHGVAGELGTELDGEEVATASSQTYSYTYSVDDDVVLQVMKAGYVENKTFAQLLSTDQNFPIIMKTETNG